ncbi:MAG: hypothetical protein V1720_13300 [bacterium]
MKKIFLFLLIFSSIFAQEKDPNKILDQVKERFDKIKDYTVDATIIVNVDFLKVPKSTAKIYFKQPDKLHLESEGFAMLPKAGLNFSPTKMLSTNHDAIFVRTENTNNRDVDVIKVIPSDDTSEVILSTLWIDKDEHVIIKVESTTKHAGTFQMEMKYDETYKIGLPSEVKFSFNVADMQMPKQMMHDQNNNPKKRDAGMKGTVVVKYKNYKVNSGLSDKLFEEKKK